MQDLVTQIREKEIELWYLYLALQELKLKDPDLFKEQDFSKLRENCREILFLIGELEVSEH
ncbi:MAG: hypothetical protein JSV16_00980 [Candidatus Hydrogenedentota bacterium]|nr:MAG: hypothetical protein JSV16_00980 [Candidatus Hydrogenedentota bacterium]